MNNALGIDEYELGCWIERLGSMPIERLVYLDLSQPYGMTRAHIFKLESGQFALVTEIGCSCYSPEQAQIDLFPIDGTAIEALNEWKKENTWE